VSRELDELYRKAVEAQRKFAIDLEERKRANKFLRKVTRVGSTVCLAVLGVVAAVQNSK
jgi:hypothetical protein